jgi:hypothetical protein
MHMPDAYAEEPKQRSWVWILGCGCLIVLLVVIGGCAGIGYAAVSMLKRTEVYAAAMETVRSSPEAQEALGTPIEAGFLVVGTYNVQNNTGRADLMIPVHGPEGRGMLRAVGTRSGEAWTIEYIGLQLEGETVFRTLRGTPPDEAPPFQPPGSDGEAGETLSI